jgi:hypothetical protein
MYVPVVNPATFDRLLPLSGQVAPPETLQSVSAPQLFDQQQYSVLRSPPLTQGGEIAPPMQTTMMSQSAPYAHVIPQSLTSTPAAPPSRANDATAVHHASFIPAVTDQMTASLITNVARQLATLRPDLQEHLASLQTPVQAGPHPTPTLTNPPISSQPLNPNTATSPLPLLSRLRKRPPSPQESWVRAEPMESDFPEWFAACRKSAEMCRGDFNLGDPYRLRVDGKLARRPR